MVKTEPVCESAWLSNQTWAWQVEGWGSSWEAAETSHGAIPLWATTRSVWSIPDLAVEAPGSCVRARREVKPVSGSSPRAPQRWLVLCAILRGLPGELAGLLRPGMHLLSLF